MERLTAQIFIETTLAYMAPEQLQSHPRPASDQYSLGVIVYEWLSGERPFSGSFMELVAKHSFVLPEPLRDRVHGLPAAVEHVVMTALAKDPQQRFATIKAFANAPAQASGLPEYESLQSISTSLELGYKAPVPIPIHFLRPRLRTGCDVRL